MASVTVRRFLMLAAAGMALPAAVPAFAIEPTTVARRVEPSMVRITVKSSSTTASASGFVVSAEGHVATTYHIVRPHIDAGWEIFAVESGAPADARRQVEVVKVFAGEDLAVLKVEGLDRPPVVLSEADTDSPPRGMAIFALGYPGAGGRLGADSASSFTAGMANRLFEGAWEKDGPRIRIIQHSAATNPGNSGGPVVNPCGQVIGVNTEREIAMILGPGGIPLVIDVIQGVFFASHVSVLIEKLKDLRIAYKGSPKVCRVFLGVASTNFAWYAAGAAAIAVVLALLLVRFWPRRVVHVIVVGGSNLGHALLHHLRFRRNRNPTWRFTYVDAEGKPAMIDVSQRDLRRSPDGLVIGCDPKCDYYLPVDGIARRHARVVPLGDRLGVINIDSDAGTAVDGRPLKPDGHPVPIDHGTRLQLGDTVLNVQRH